MLFCISEPVKNMHFYIKHLWNSLSWIPAEGHFFSLWWSRNTLCPEFTAWMGSNTLRPHPAGSGGTLATSHPLRLCSFSFSGEGSLSSWGAWQNSQVWLASPSSSSYFGCLKSTGSNSQAEKNQRRGRSLQYPKQWQSWFLKHKTMIYHSKEKYLLQKKKNYCKKSNPPQIDEHKIFVCSFEQKERGCLFFSKPPPAPAFISPMSCHGYCHIRSCYVTAQDHIFPTSLAQYSTWPGITLSLRKTVANSLPFFWSQAYALHTDF